MSRYFADVKNKRILKTEANNHPDINAPLGDYYELTGKDDSNITTEIFKEPGTGKIVRWAYTEPETTTINALNMSRAIFLAKHEASHFKLIRVELSTKDWNWVQEVCR